MTTEACLVFMSALTPMHSVLTLVSTHHFEWCYYVFRVTTLAATPEWLGRKKYQTFLTARYKEITRNSQ